MLFIIYSLDVIFEPLITIQKCDFTQEKNTNKSL